MATFDVHNLEIKSKLPEWWKEDTFLTPINQYTQALIIGLVGGLLNNVGVVQPFNVWKWLPEEYNWVHNYYSSDEYLGGRDATLRPNYILDAFLPNTKRNCDAIITLELTGNNKGTYDENGEFEKKHQEDVEITITNGTQELVISKVNNISTIQIYTETGAVYINGIQNSDLITGKLGKIQPVPKSPNFRKIKDGKETDEPIDISDENKVTKISLTSDKEVNFDLKIELIKPVYVTEQHIRLHTVSAFPLEWVKLYGFYCHEFNNEEGYRFLWQKTYNTDDRVVYDKITKQYDCERFYIQVKLYGIGIPLSFGFPQEQLSGNPAFAINDKLDKWGKIYGLPRRIYRDNISLDEEGKTFPQYYNYPIEQDYWYEERLVNEYRHNIDAQNGLFLKDTDFNNVALLECISPYIKDIWVFTETILPETDIQRETGEIPPCRITQLDDNGIDWGNPQTIKGRSFISNPLHLAAHNDKSYNNFSYKTKSLRLRFNLRNLDIPKNIKITGLQLKFDAETDMHSNALRLDPARSVMLLNTINRTDGGMLFSKQKKVNIAVDIETWKKGQKKYTIGGKDFLFGETKIDREQLFRKVDNQTENYIDTGYLDFIIAFENTNDSLDATLLIHAVTLEIFYTLYQDEFSIKADLSSHQILKAAEEDSVNLKITVENTGMTEIENKKIFIAVPPELEIENNKDEFDFDLDIGESFTIGNQKAINQYGLEYDDPDDIITIKTVDGRTGIYDIIVFCDDKVIKDEIIVKEGFEWEV